MSVRAFTVAAIVALFASVGASAQIRDELSDQQQAVAQDTDAAIAKSELSGEHDTKARHHFIVATDRWYECAKTYSGIVSAGSKAAISYDKALVAVLSCSNERLDVTASAKAYFTLNGTPKNADGKSRYAEVVLREMLATRLRQMIQWESNQ